MSLVRSALGRTSREHPFLVFGTAGLTLLTIVSIIMAAGSPEVSPSDYIATAPATYVSPYQTVTPAAAAVVSPAPLPLPQPTRAAPVERRAAPVVSLAPRPRRELDNVTIRTQGLQPHARPELDGLALDPRTSGSALRPIDRPELRALKNGAN
jgi:hypothetical protein